MRLLGTYNSQLQTSYYNQLIDLLNQAVRTGDFGGGSLLTKSDINTILNQSKQFSGFTNPTSGTRVLDKDLNYFLQTLQAQINSINLENKSFNNNLQILIDILSNDINLLNKIVNATKQSNTDFFYSRIKGSQVYSNNFIANYGLIKSNQSNIPIIDNIIDTSLNEKMSGLVCNRSTSNFTIKDLSWQFDDTFIQQELYANNLSWTKLLFLSPRVQLNYLNPTINVLLPNGASTPFTISGNSNTKGISIYTKTAFLPRRIQKSITSSPFLSTSLNYPISRLDNIYINVSAISDNTSHTTKLYLKYKDIDGNIIKATSGVDLQTLLGGFSDLGLKLETTVQIPDNPAIATTFLSMDTTHFTLVATGIIYTPFKLESTYKIGPNNINVYTDSIYYIQDNDYVINASLNSITFKNIPANSNLTIRYTEYFPAYQSSLDRKNWSQYLFFDNVNPFVDSNAKIVNLGIDSNGFRTLLPIIDDLNNNTGLYISLNQSISNEYLIEIFQNTDHFTSGFTSNLKLTLDKNTYINYFILEPFTQFPVTIKSIKILDLSGNTTIIFSGNLILEEKIKFKFPTLIGYSIIVEFLQNNYSINTYLTQPEDIDKLVTLNDLQSIIPSSARESYYIFQKYTTGYTYEFGIRDMEIGIETIDNSNSIILGDFVFNGSPDIIHFICQSLGSVDIKFNFYAYDTNNNQIDSGTNITLQLDKSLYIPFNISKSLISKCKFEIKLTLNNSNTVITNYKLQVL